MAIFVKGATVAIGWWSGGGAWLGLVGVLLAA